MTQENAIALELKNDRAVRNVDKSHQILQLMLTSLRFDQSMKGMACRKENDLATRVITYVYVMYTSVS